MQQLIALYRTNAWFRGLVQAIEAGAILGCASISLDPSDIITSHGLKHIGIAVGGGILVAVRNYLVNRPGSPAGELPSGGK
jgi:hypothetical protein